MNSEKNKRTCTRSREEMTTLLAVARSEAPADYRIDNVRILDLINGGEFPGPVVISGNAIAGVGTVYKDAPAHQVIDGKNAVVVPGFIDAHLHIESGMMTPVTFESATLPLGVTTIVCDPHEIVNVMGEEGIEWFLRCAEQAQQNQFVQVSSCVPALPGSDVNGADFPLTEMLKYKDHSHVLGLAEMMNFPAVIAGEAETLDKLDAFRDMTLDGHCPMVTGKDLNGYIAGGIENCHESHRYEEGLEKLALGMALMIREGSAARNLDALAPLITAMSSPQCLLCTDDRNPWEIIHEGHMNALVYRLINQHQIPVHIAYRVASWSAARHFGLKNLGLVAPGKQADLVLLRDEKTVDIQAVMCGGRWVDKAALLRERKAKQAASRPPMQNTVRRQAVTAQSLAFVPVAGHEYRAISVIPNELITCEQRVSWDGHRYDRDNICSLAVIERYGRQTPPATALLHNFGLTRGALASTVSHDSHNIVVAGIDPMDMALAVNQLIAGGGGMCVVADGRVLSHATLPIAGLMSDKTADEIAAEIESLKAACRDCGVMLDEPFIQMAFLSLPVIPTLKLTSLGLYDVNKFVFTHSELTA
ncbi:MULTISPECIES: adenine deaminase [Morganella]|uniref:adenine deaminase n=1 Tax=Morganella TaxID=581 RepID=UPI00041906DA|nr:MULTISPECIES: adenine deaminase [Morganella]ELB1850316.1 adenine deaminase [Morganella morganii]ETO42188.1 adenine deaminase [Morganella sp. EGD-HP17]MBT0416322.1 adenine deaminase [Morganella morganii subsp. morganii]MBT0489391.1 adenine deaminase [Morganella morganii subsp. morganii]MBT0492779.1 adenine deaminase [Morganella morganii subsp. morganii]